MSADLVPIVLQARLGSTRLPGKSLALLGDRPLVEHCIRRLEAAGVGPVVLATTTRKLDDPLAEAAEGLGIRVFRGPEDDVLQRFVLVADYLDARYLIRATGDNPAVDIDAPGRVASMAMISGADHVVESGLPLGAAVEAVRVAALYQAAAQTREAYDREHVTPYLYRTPGRFRAVAVLAPRSVRRPDIRLTVDTQADLEFMRDVWRRLDEPRSLAPLTSIIAAADLVGRGATNS